MNTRDDAEGLVSLLLRLARSAESACFAEGLNPAQWAALRYFGHANRFSRTASAFARFHGTSRGTASQSIRALVDKGLLCSRPELRDRRALCIELSAAGVALLRRDPVEHLNRAVAALGDEGRAALGEGLAALRAGLAAQGPPGATAALDGFGRCRDCVRLRAEPGGRLRCAAVDEPLAPAELDCICIDHRPARSVRPTPSFTTTPLEGRT